MEDYMSFNNAITGPVSGAGITTDGQGNTDENGAPIIVDNTDNVVEAGEVVATDAPNDPDGAGDDGD